MSTPPAAGVAYRCPLCSQRFVGRQPLSAFEPLADGAVPPLPALVEQSVTADLCRRDQVVAKHIIEHSPIEWLGKIAALEQTIETLRAEASRRTFQAFAGACVAAGVVNTGPQT